MGVFLVHTRISAIAMVPQKVSAFPYTQAPLRPHPDFVITSKGRILARNKDITKLPPTGPFGRGFGEKWSKKYRLLSFLGSSLAG